MSKPGWHRKADLLAMSSIFPSVERQQSRLVERRQAALQTVKVCGRDIAVFPGVYRTGVDTTLMIEHVRVGLKPHHEILEVGCGSGAVVLSLAPECKRVVGVDISSAAVENSKYNADLLEVSNALFAVSDVFEVVTGRFDTLICNPPYNLNSASDSVDRMFWDPDDEMKHAFFANAQAHLKRNGRIFFGWADFADLDSSLPTRLAEREGFKLVKWSERPAKGGEQRFFVLEFRQ